MLHRDGPPIGTVAVSDPLRSRSSTIGISISIGTR